MSVRYHVVFMVIKGVETCEMLKFRGTSITQKWTLIREIVFVSEWRELNGLPYGSQFLLLKTYFCPEKHCISNQPPWENISFPEKIAAGDGVSMENKKKIEKKLGL